MTRSIPVSKVGRRDDRLRPNGEAIRPEQGIRPASSAWWEGTQRQVAAPH